MIFDTFPINDELEMLTCRVYELQDVPGLVHVAVEANVTHQDVAKPYLLSEAMAGGFLAEYAERIIIVRATGLPTVADAPDPWARERAQREYCSAGLIQGGAENDDIVLHGDIDEIVNPLVARNVRPRGYVALSMVGHFWSCRWRYGPPWLGTVAARAGNIKSFCDMRDARTVAPQLPNSGNHLSWLGGEAAVMRKVDAFCHP